MNLCRNISLLFFIVLLATAKNLSAQNNNYVVGIGAGSLIYQGDLVPGYLGGYRTLKPAFQFYAGKWINPYFQVRATFAAGKILANDADYTTPAWKRERNLRFQTSIHELTARLVFSPFGNETLIHKRFFPYVFAGAGVSFVNIKRDWSKLSSSFTSDEKTASYLAADSAHQPPSFLASLPFGAGFNYVLSPRLSFYGEVAYHIPVTDYLDGFSYIADPKKKDNSYSLNAGISYTLFKNGYTKCPRVKKQGHFYK